MIAIGRDTAMTKAVLTTKVAPTYDDLPEERYHFPRTYLRAVEAAAGDWIVYYEPRRTSGELSSRGGRQAYFAVARLDRIAADPVRPDHFYAFVSQYLEFDHSVPFRVGEHYFEATLKRDDGATNRGSFGRAVRPLSDVEFDLILRAGFANTLHAAAERPSSPALPSGLREEAAVFDRPLVERVVARPFRDAAFAAAVKSAYGDTCAITGLRIVNGGGRAEVQAAHIRPVAQRGPDSLRNGLALSGTVHWMFDRGLLGVDDDFRVIAARGHVPPEIERLFLPDRRLHLPSRHEAYPHPQFLRYHREHVFKG